MAVDLQALRALSLSNAFNRWCGIEVRSADLGTVQLTLPWRSEFGQSAGHLHAGLIGALVDTAGRLAACTLAGPVRTSHYSVKCIRQAQGQRFTVKGQVVRADVSAVVAACDLFVSTDGEDDVHVATGEATFKVVFESR